MTDSSIPNDRPHKTRDGEERPACPYHPYSGAEYVGRFGKLVCPKCRTVIGWAEPTDPLVILKPDCAHCGKPDEVRLTGVRNTDGHITYRYHCFACDRTAIYSRASISKEAAARTLEYYRYRFPNSKRIPKSIDEISIGVDNLGVETCRVCGRRGVQFAHFVPQAFRDHPLIADNWRAWSELGFDLCRECHRIYHEVVAPLDDLRQLRQELMR